MATAKDKAQPGDKFAAAAALPEIPANLRARNAPGAIKDQLQAEYVKSADLAGMGRFNIIGAYVRESNYGEECAYEVQLVDPGKLQGTTATVTLRETPIRRKMVDLVKKLGSVGPYVLRPVGENKKGNPPWGFVPADGSEAIPF